MNEKEIAFIICVNQIDYYEECMRYINELNVPKGYTTDTICIQEADSMTQGYQAGMQSSNAKYKIYLHQDTFICNKNLIKDMLEIFRKDSQIGMIGVKGTERVAVDDRQNWVWDTETAASDYMPVQAVAGFLCMTQYDIPWREDLFTGWECAEISQALEMQRRGYQVVVPYQKTPWCYHEGGSGHIDRSSEDYRHLIDEYVELELRELELEQQCKQKKEKQERKDFRNLLTQLMEMGEYGQLYEAVEKIRELKLQDKMIQKIINIIEIYDLEEKSVLKLHSSFFSNHNWHQILETYNWIMFVLKRMEENREDDRIGELNQAVRVGDISEDAVYKIAEQTLSKKHVIYDRLLKLNTEPLVSVIVPVYNGENFVGETLESILKQTYDNMEIIIVDDASTDHSRDVIETYARKDKRIKTVFSKENHHICYSGNLGFEAAKGDYVALIGHDDLWKPDKIKRQVAFMKKHPDYSVCFTWADFIDEKCEIRNEKWSTLYERMCSDNTSQESWLHKMIVQKNYFCAPSACIRRSCLEQVGYYRYALVQLQDYDLWIRLLGVGPIYVLPEKLTCYRRFEENGKNLSLMDNDAETRAWHENQWIIAESVKQMEDELFVRVFHNELRNKQASGKKEIECEKAFLLWDLQICFAQSCFIELFEDAQCRALLAEKYQFTLKDFYKMNTQAMHFDASQLLLVREQKKIIEDYKKNETQA